LLGLTREDAARRKRAAVELVAREERALLRTAQRYSLCADDAEDAVQRALEILLTKAPTDRPRELARWMQTVVKHEALAIRAYRERMLGSPPGGEGKAVDPVAAIPSPGDDPAARTERREGVARSREALRTLKPAELRALTLLAAGYSYAEIGELTGFSRTKVNRSLAEGRERFRRVMAQSEDGSRCEAMLPLLSAHCDGETSAVEAARVREHLRACAGCRAAMRAFRSTPATVAALAPAGFAALAGGGQAPPSLLQRAQELLLNLQSRLPGAGRAADSSVAQATAAGSAGGGIGSAGMAALAKTLAVCAGTVGGAAACVATGVVPAPLDLGADQVQAPKVERVSQKALGQITSPAAEDEPVPKPEPQPRREQKHVREHAPEAATEAIPAAEEAGGGRGEYTPSSSAPPVETSAPSPPAEAPAPSPPAEAPAAADSAAGEFGP